ncbi:MAG TPA: helix-turn-helix transcriptional regulator [Solirubrobacteraceae bacterium]|nr:helix-turn-helix transcriptional regulator [Solirubrobacteraceae bacterium]
MPPPRRSKPRSPDHAALAGAVERVMAQAGMTQEQLAERSGLNVKQINALVRGQANPTYENILKICRGLEVSSGVLMSLVDELRERPPRRQRR